MGGGRKGERGREGDREGRETEGGGGGRRRIEFSQA